MALCTDMAKLTAKQARFCTEYLIDLNATQAALRAGYAKKAAYKTGSENLKKPQVAEEIDRLNLERARTAAITPAWVLGQFLQLADVDVRVVFRDDGTMLPFAEWPENVGRAIASIKIDDLNDHRGKKIGITKTVKFHSKVACLTALAKHLKLLTDRIELDVTNDLAEALAEAIRRVENLPK